MNELLHLIASVKNNPIVWAQGVHFLLGFMVLLLAYRGGRRRNFWPFALGVLAWSLFIEIWYDPKYEGSPFFWDGVLDMALYLAGAGVGLIVDMAGEPEHPLRLALRKSLTYRR